jgi:hypothetical protein
VTIESMIARQRFEAPWFPRVTLWADHPRPTMVLTVTIPADHGGDGHHSQQMQQTSNQRQQIKP